MSQVMPALPAYARLASFHRFSVATYHRMLKTGILDEDGRIELLEGYLVKRMGYNPPHAISVVRTKRRIERLAGSGWEVREEKPITLADSEPQPDVAVARGDETTYETRHPGPAELALVVEVADSSLDIDRQDMARIVEVADSSLDIDRQDMARIYARAGIVEYWIVNIPDRQIEVYTQPSGPCATPTYGNRQDYPSGSTVPFVLDGVSVGTIAVDDVMR